MADHTGQKTMTAAHQQAAFAGAQLQNFLHFDSKALGNLAAGLEKHGIDVG